MYMSYVFFNLLSKIIIKNHKSKVQIITIKGHESSLMILQKSSIHGNILDIKYIIKLHVKSFRSK